MQKILIIEDDLIDQMTFIRMLKKQDFEFVHTIANSIQSAKKELEHQNFDLVISDHNLPDGTAFDLLDDLKNTPFILITGNENKLMVEAMAENSNAVACFSKDINFNYLKELPKVIHQVFNQKNTLHQSSNNDTFENNNQSNKQENVIVDFSIAFKIFDDKKNEVKEAIEIFIQHKPDEMNSLYNYINSNNCEKVMEIAHRMKSGFRLFGMTEQVQLSEFIENNVTSSDKKCQCPTINEAFKKLSSDTKVGIQILKKELALL